MSQQVNSLTPEQKAKVSEYKEKFIQLGLSTRPTDKGKAEAAILRLYAYLNTKDSETCVTNPEILWANNPIDGQKLAAQHANGTLTPTSEQIKDVADIASYGSLEAYWIVTYAFINNELPVQKDPLVDIVVDIIEECGVYWTFQDLAIITPKPTKISLVDEKLSCLDGPALEYPDGLGFYAYNGERKCSLMEVVMAARNEQKE